MTSLALKFILIWGWKRCLTAACVGAFASLSLPPVSIWPTFLISFPVLIWLLDGVNAQADGRARLWPAFVTGWSFAFGYFAASLFWIGEAFLVEADVFAWALPFAVTLMPAGLALFWGAATALAIIAWRPGPMRILSLGASLGLFEWLRGSILSGFPWNAPGYATDAIPQLEQIAGLTGLYGTTFWVILWSAMPVLLADDAEVSRNIKSRLAGLGLCLVSLAGALIYGQARLSGFEPSDQPGMLVRIVQPNIEQREKWKVENRDAIFQRYLDLTQQPSSVPVTHVIWPESALPVLIGELPDIRRQIAASLPGSPVFIMGAITRMPKPGDELVHVVHNSVIAFSASGTVFGEYHKRFLVPFGEYLPLGRWLEPLGLRKMVTLPLGFSAGEGPALLDIPDTPSFVPLVCYEAIFPFSRQVSGQRPQWILNVTNDAWFGTSIGPWQHLAQARMRAIEQGLPLLRAANTGISAVIDPVGGILHRRALGETGIIDTRLPAPLAPTIYATYGNMVFFFTTGLAFLAVYGHFSAVGRKFRRRNVYQSMHINAQRVAKRITSLQ